MKYLKCANFFGYDTINYWIAAIPIIPPFILLIIIAIVADKVGWEVLLILLILFLFFCLLLFIQSLISYPFKIIRVMRMKKRKECITDCSAGRILGSYVCKTSVEYHYWDGCKCTQCRIKRDEQHDWDGCKCRRCRITGNHDWDGCKCRRCGEARNKQHKWNGCKCTECGETRDEQHEWNCCECTQCRKIRNEVLDFNCKCKNCGKEMHDWGTITIAVPDGLDPSGHHSYREEQDYGCRRCYKIQ